MALLPPPISHTVDAIYAAYAAGRSNHYDGLGISISDLGNECDRAVWYAMRWASPQEVVTGLKAIIFETGEIEEERLLNSLRMIGAEVEAVDPRTGRQVRVSAVFGFVRGKIDGKVLGLPEAPKTWHVVECKSAKETYYKPVVKKGVREGYFAHWVQLNTYCHLLGFDRGLYMLRNKNTGEIYCERIKTDHDAAIRMLANAERIVATHEPPVRLFADPTAKTAFKCRSMCRHKPICHDGVFPRVNCRTCLHATPERLEDATISCALDEAAHARRAARGLRRAPLPSVARAGRTDRRRRSRRDRDLSARRRRDVGRRLREGPPRRGRRSCRGGRVMPVHFLDARALQCRFPVEGEGLSLVVCGDRVTPGKSYCPACCAIVYVPTKGFDPKVRWVDPSVKVTSPKCERARDLVEAMP